MRRADAIAARLRGAGRAAGAHLRAVPRPGGPRWPLALAAYLAAALWATWPLARGLGDTTYGGPGDGWALIWQTWERERSGVSYFSVAEYPDLAWPFGTLTSTAAFLSNAAVELPNVLLLRLGVGDVAAYNIIVLAGLVLSSAAMYAVVRRLGCAPGVAFWAGLVYMLAPWHLVKASIHPTLAMMVWLPLAVLGVVEFARRPGLRPGALLVAACTLGIYTHVYYGLMAAVVLLVGAPVVLVAASARRQVLRTLPRMAGVAGAVGLAALPLAFALRRQSEEVGDLIDRPLYLDSLAGAVHRYLLPSPDNPLLGAHTERYIGARGLEPMRGELALYLGWITVALVAVALVGVVLRRVPMLPALSAAGVAAAGFLLALPATLSLPLVGRVTGPVEHVQAAVTFVSTPSRFFALTLTGCVIIAALGLQWAWAHAPGRALAAGLVAVACAASAAELVTRPADVVVPAGPTELARQVAARVPPGEGVAQYPSTDRSLRPVADQLFHQVFHRRPLVNGATVGTPEDAIRREMSLIELPGLARHLALIGVDWVTVDPGMYPFAPFQENQPDAIARVEAQGGWRTVWTGPGGERVMRVGAAPAAGLAARAQGFWVEGSLDTMWLRGDEGTRGHVLVCVPRAGRYTLRFPANSLGGERVLRLGDSGDVRVPSVLEPREIRVPLDLRAGWQWLEARLVEGPPPVRPSEAIAGSTDTRLLALWFGRIAVDGPRAPDAAGACAGPLPEPPAADG